MDAWTARDNYAFAILIAGERDSRTCPKRQHGKGDNTPSGEADLILGLPDRPPSAPLILLPSTLSLGEYLPFYNLETIPIHPRISIYPSIYSQLVLLSPFSVDEFKLEGLACPQVPNPTQIPIRFGVPAVNGGNFSPALSDPDIVKIKSFFSFSQLSEPSPLSSRELSVNNTGNQGRGGRQGQRRTMRWFVIMRQSFRVSLA